MNKTVLITGSSSGIGLELAKIFANNGFKLVLVSRGDMPKFDYIENVTLLHLKIDLSQVNSADKVVKALKDKNISIDMLVNNAGFGDYGLFVNADIKKLDQMIQLNIATLTDLTQALLPHMLKNGGGKIMNVASVAAFLPGPHMAVYYATKHYVLAFSEALAEELKSSNITVTALCPGATASGFQVVANANKAKFFKGNLASSADVASYGYKSMLNGKRVAVPGFKNKLTTFAPRLFPRYLVAKAVSKSS